MAFVVADRVQETTTTTGTGTVTLAGAVTGFQSFAAVGNGNTTFYTITDGTNWEVGIGTYTSSGTTLSRDTVLSSSNSGSLVNFSAGTKNVFVTYPAGRSAYGLTAGTGVTLTPGNGTTTITATGASPGGSSGELQFNNSGAFGGLGDLTWDDISGLKVGSGYDVNFYNLYNTNYIGVRAPSSLATDWELVLPTTEGTNGQVLTTNGSGVTSWTTVSGGGGMSPVTAAMIWG
tara:strand:- start:287 stop:982 length:696 start_codon:yes stop_codon:yes gene_type:complete